MIGIAIAIGSIFGALVGFILPTVPYTISKYLAIAIVAAMDSVFGGIASNIKKNFDMGVFLSGFFVNSILAILLTYLGQRLNIDIYLAAIVVFVGRMFYNLGTIRRHYLDLFRNKKQERDNLADKKKKDVEKIEKDIEENL